MAIRERLREQDRRDRLGTHRNQADRHPTSPVEVAELWNAAQQEGQQKQADQGVLDDDDLRRLQMTDELGSEVGVGGPHGGGHADQHHGEPVDETAPSGLPCRL